MNPPGAAARWAAAASIGLGASWEKAGAAINSVARQSIVNLQKRSMGKLSFHETLWKTIWSLGD
jgi:hypothetical protein